MEELLLARTSALSEIRAWVTHELQNWENLTNVTGMAEGVDSKAFIHANSQREAYERCRMKICDVMDLLNLKETNVPTILKEKKSND